MRTQPHLDPRTDTASPAVSMAQSVVGFGGRRGWLVAVCFALLAVVVSAPLAHAGPDRHFEKVSPAEKGNGDIVGDGLTTTASHDGDAVAFATRTPFGDTVGSGAFGQSQFVARRNAAGWTTRAVTPTSRPDAVQVFFARTNVEIYSDDLRTAIVWAYDLPGVSGAPPLRNSIYAEDTATRELEPITVSQVDQPTVYDFLNLTTWGISADARHVSFVTSTQFLPEAMPGVPNVYQWDHGVLSLAGILHDGTVPPDGSDLVPAQYRSAMSEDGTRLAFTASSQYGPSQLFMRIGGGRTVWISQPELGDEQQNGSTPSPAALQAVTPDGHVVFFTTDTGLLDEDTNGSTDLYRYTDSSDPSSSKNLTMISTDGDLGGGQVIGTSDDGERVYYQTVADRLSVWDYGTTRLISTAATMTGSSENSLAATASEPGLGRVTPDGRYLAFGLRSSGPQDLLGNETNGHLEMYLYDLDGDRLECISCPSGPAMVDANIQPNVTSGSPQVVNTGFRPRFLSDRGQVFFSTAEALASQDINGVVDVYEYDPRTGRVDLISTGTGSDPANFADASASGDDVFILTRQRLVRADRDDLVDLYDAREGSSLPDPQPDEAAPCDGDACRPPPSASPARRSIGSSVLGQSYGGPLRSARLVARHRVTVRGTSGALPVKLSTAGTLRWRGRGLRPGSIRRGRSGTYVALLRVGRRARQQLMTSGRYTTSVRLTFVSPGGDKARRTTRVTFRAVAGKGR